MREELLGSLGSVLALTGKPAAKIQLAAEVMTLATDITSRDDQALAS